MWPKEASGDWRWSEMGDLAPREGAPMCPHAPHPSYLAVWLQG